MNFNCNTQPFVSNRFTNVSSNGAVATSQPLAASAGLEILKKGGNAVDAAIACAACLTVVEPTSNGLGSDAFALVWIKEDKKLYGLNASGPSPKNISAQKVKEKGFEKMPKYGWTPVTVPGAVGAWVELSKKYGKLPLTEVLKPAIKYANEGFPLSPTLAKYWKKAYDKFSKELTGDEFKEWFNTFSLNSKCPTVGDIWSSKNHGETLQHIANTNGESFYKGKIAEKIHECSKKYGGYITKEDLENYKPTWVEPIKVNYKGYDICEIPPNGQGIVALMALNILKNYKFSLQNDTESYHLQFEAIKLAFADAKKYVTDYKYMDYSCDNLLSEDFANQRKSLITNKAITPTAGKPYNGGTVYLCTADKEGNMVSFIQSNYMGFGSGIVVDGTGIALQNRGADFSLNKEDYNYLQPSKKSYHTIIPGFILKNNEAVGPFGVMGGYMQPQGHVQVATNLIDFNYNPQMALDAPRWRWVEGKKFEVEQNFPPHIINELTEKGHEISIVPYGEGFGRGQIIVKKDNVYFSGTESRTDGSVASY